MKHQSGFVNIIGNPNVGKSTIMNTLVGEKISIITSKAQTTRHRIMGIVNEENFQIVYSDTPGILQPKYKLQEAMVKFIDIALSDADIIIYVTDVKETPDKHKEYLQKIQDTKIPVILLMNKIDLVDDQKVEELKMYWESLLPEAVMLCISALYEKNTELILPHIIKLLPEGPPYFSKTDFTDKPARFFVSEIIREKILMNYKQEIPYCTEVVVEEFKDEEKIIRIRSIIYVDRNSQKGILIGHKGSALKKTGTLAREDIEAFFEKKVFLELHVKVKKDWRNNHRILSSLGYN